LRGDENGKKQACGKENAFNKKDELQQEGSCLGYDADRSKIHVPSTQKELAQEQIEGVR